MLNPQQKAAVTYTDGPLLVLAGAGSGKTRVIIQKIVHLIEQCDYPARSICAVTFTNKAALEMKQRIQRLLAPSIRRGLKIATFHTLGLHILKQSPSLCGLHQAFSIMDSEDCLGLIQTFLPEARKRDRQALRQIQQQISTWKNALFTPEAALKEALDEDTHEMAGLFRQYQQTLRNYNAVDFDDLIGLPVILFQQHPDVLARWQQRIRHLLIDEYQDSNQAQYQLLTLLVGQRGAFTAVGDDAQSIYAWRGAKPENLLHLQRDFAQLKCIKLEQNYRSTGRILHVANQLIAHNPAVYEKQLWSALGPGDLIRVLSCKDGQDEAEQVVADLINHRLRHGQNYGDYAMLYRSNHQARLFEHVLRLQSIPYRITGGDSWFARTEIKDMLAYMKLLCNIQDDASFLRIFNTPKRGIGTTTVEALTQYARQKQQSLFVCAQHLGFLSQINEKSRQAIETFQHWFNTLKMRCQQEPMMPILREMVKTMGYEAHLYDLHDTSLKAQKCMDNIEELMLWIERLLEKKPERTLSDILNTLQLLDIMDQAKDSSPDGVQLMTLHASKGLEFPFVYLVGMEEEILPHRNSVEDCQIEEERRLAYVGITRAQRLLTLTLAKQRRRGGELHQTSPSRFLDELPQESLEWYGQSTATAEQSRARAQSHLTGIRQLLGN